MARRSGTRSVRCFFALAKGGGPLATIAKDTKVCTVFLGKDNDLCTECKKVEFRNCFNEVDVVPTLERALEP